MYRTCLQTDQPIPEIAHKSFSPSKSSDSTEQRPRPRPIVNPTLIHWIPPSAAELERFRKKHPNFGSNFYQEFCGSKPRPVTEAVTPPMTSRAHSGTLPDSSPSTPIPHSSVTSPTGTAHHGDKAMAFSLSAMESTDEVSSSEISGAIGKDAKRLVSKPQELDADRAAEFKEHTTQGRKAARGDAECIIAKESEDEDPQQGSPVYERHGPSQEKAPDVRDANGDLAKPKQETSRPRTQAAWVTEAVAACQTNKKNPLNRGTVLLVLDPTDLTKSCLLDTSTFCRASDVFEKLYQDAQVKSSGCVSDQGLTGLLLLSSASTTELLPEAIDVSIESVLPPSANDHHTPAELGRTRSTRNAKVKAESDHQGDDAHAAADEPDALEIDWVRAYEAFLRMLAGKKHGIPRSDLSKALPQIQGVVEIAQKYDAIPAVQGAFDSLFFGYVGKDTFWTSVRCIKIAIALQNKPVYEEAFKHIVGSNASFKDRGEFSNLPDDVQAIVQRRSRDLYLKRRDVEDKLMRITLAKSPPSRSAPVPSDYQSQFVSQHDQPIAYSMVNVFRDWITEHISHLRSENDAEPAPSFLCDHETGCHTVAGFFRTIQNQTYLYSDDVWEGFNERFKSSRSDRHQSEGEMVKNSLEALKAKASGFVEGMSVCTLRLAEQVEYLTCIEVMPEDVPWDLGSDEDSSQDGEEESDED